jgi:serine/threonine protein kinase
MLIGKSVFDAKTLKDLVKKVEEGTYTVPTSLSKEIVSFLNGMLQYKSEKRLSAEKLYNHPFLTRNIREFHKIDTKRVSHKIDNKGLNINVKKNTTIWSIFNQADETKLLNIQGEGDGDNLQLKKAYSVDQSSNISSTLNSSGNGSVYSVISNNSNISNTHFTPKVEDYHHHNFNPNAMNIGNSFYGQNMHISNNIQNPSNLQNQNFRIQQQASPLVYTNTFPNNRMNNNINLHQNIANPGNQINYGINNNGYINSSNNNIPMNNDETNQQGVCLIM